MTKPIPRSANDWAALRKAELEGREEPGTYARLTAQEAPMAATGFQSAAEVLALLGNQEHLVAKLEELRSAVAAAHAASAAAKLAQENLAKQQAQHDHAVAEFEGRQERAREWARAIVKDAK
jgi:hypothetical protein